MEVMSTKIDDNVVSFASKCKERLETQNTEACINETHCIDTLLIEASTTCQVQSTGKTLNYNKT